MQEVSSGLHPTSGPQCVGRRCVPRALPPASSRRQGTVMRTQLVAAAEQKGPSADSPRTGDPS